MPKTLLTSTNHGFRMALLGALGLLPFAACGGASTPDAANSEQPNTEAGAPDPGSAGEGGINTTGGTTGSGGQSVSGGRTGSGGRVTAGGQPTMAGAGGAIIIPSGGRPVMAGAGGVISTAGSSPGGGPGKGGSVGAGGATAGAPSTPPFPCTPVDTARPAPPADPIVAPPQSIVECSGNWRHRPSDVECVSLLPRSEPVPPVDEELDQCTEDADCTASPHGYCGTRDNSMAPGTACLYGCVNDSDCGEGQLCECGSLIGRCVVAKCKTDAECGDGLLCASYSSMPGCNFPAFACQSYDDVCVSNSDCTNGEECTYSDATQSRICQSQTCAVGRPFLVEGQGRLAEMACRGDWLEALEPSLVDLTAAERAELATEWTRIGLMEHASVAAFARFSLELLAFGAPASLLESSARAMSDETAHARKAFALASAYAGEARGPGRLAIDGSLSNVELDACLLTTFLEGCVGETVAALEAREAATLARDPAVRAVLSQIADEEAQHALLAYEFVRWALPRAGASLPEALRASLQGELEHAEASVVAHGAEPRSRHAETLVAHGILPESRRCELRRSVLREVVAPCLEALLAAGADEAAQRVVSPRALERQELA